MSFINYYEVLGHQTSYGLEEQENYNIVVSEPENK